MRALNKAFGTGWKGIPGVAQLIFIGKSRLSLAHFGSRTVELHWVDSVAVGPALPGDARRDVRQDRGLGVSTLWEKIVDGMEYIVGRPRKRSAVV